MNNVTNKISIATEDWAAIIKIYRKMFDLTQEEMANRVGCNRRCISEWESQKTFPQRNKQLKLQELLAPVLDDVLCEMDVKKTVLQKQAFENNPNGLQELLASYKAISPKRYKLFVDINNLSDEDVDIIQLMVDRIK